METGIIISIRSNRLQYLDFSYDVVDTVGDYLLLTVQN